MIFLAAFSALGAARRWGYAAGVLAAYISYIALSLSFPLGLASVALFLALGRGVKLDRYALLALGLASFKFLLLPFLLGRPLPYYEALWYASRQLPAWQTYAPLTYLPREPPLELAFDGTFFVVWTAALAGRALAEELGPASLYWPLLATEPVYFGQFYMSAPLVWTTIYYARRKKAAMALASAVLALGFHVYGGLLAGLSMALWGQVWVLLLAPLAFLTPEASVLYSYAARIPGFNPASALSLFHYANPAWGIKVAVEGLYLLVVALLSGRMAAIPALGLLGAFLTARSPTEFGGLLYRHFFVVYPFAAANMGSRPLYVAAALASALFAVEVSLFGLSWGWAAAYARAFSSGVPIKGPVEEAYAALYG